MQLIGVPSIDPHMAGKQRISIAGRLWWTPGFLITPGAPLTTGVTTFEFGETRVRMAFQLHGSLIVYLVDVNSSNH